MKHALKMLYQRYPDVKKAQDNPALSVNMTSQELVFLQLSLFLSNPQRHDFYMSKVHENLQDDDLVFFFDVMKTFYEKDTKKLDNASNLFAVNVKETDTTKFYKGSTFLERIEKEIPNTTLSQPGRFWSYLSQKIVLPSPDLVIDTVKFWKDSTIQNFIEREKKTTKRKMVE